MRLIRRTKVIHPRWWSEEMYDDFCHGLYIELFDSIDLWSELADPKNSVDRQLHRLASLVQIGRVDDAVDSQS